MVEKGFFSTKKEKNVFVCPLAPAVLATDCDRCAKRIELATMLTRRYFRKAVKQQIFEVTKKSRKKGLFGKIFCLLLKKTRAGEG